MANFFSNLVRACDILLIQASSFLRVLLAYFLGGLVAMWWSLGSWLVETVGDVGGESD